MFPSEINKKLKCKVCGYNEDYLLMLINDEEIDMLIPTTDLAKVDLCLCEGCVEKMSRFHGMWEGLDCELVKLYEKPDIFRTVLMLAEDISECEAEEIDNFLSVVTGFMHKSKMEEIYKTLGRHDEWKNRMGEIFTTEQVGQIIKEDNDKCKSK